MLRRVTPRIMKMILRTKRVAAAVVVVCLALYPAKILGISPPTAVPIDSFLSGVEIPQEAGYSVSDFVLGDYRVTDLFETTSTNRHSYAKKTGALVVKVKNEESLAELKKKSLHIKDLQISVIMNKQAVYCRALGGLISIGCIKRTEIPFIMD
jgi:hypothetical protein